MEHAIPQHVALILDGNRTWAKEQGLHAMEGHTAGAKNVQPIVEAALDAGVRYVTVYALSTENVKRREKVELNHLMELLVQVRSYITLFHEQQVRFQTIGDVEQLPKRVQRAIRSLEDDTADYQRLTFTIAVNYGGRNELVHTMQRMINAGYEAHDITEEQIQAHLDTATMPDVDLMIRTGGYQRLSNFLLWQHSYAELYFTETRWPAFSPEHFAEALLWFSQQKRKKGK